MYIEKPKKPKNFEKTKKTFKILYTICVPSTSSIYSFFRHACFEEKEKNVQYVIENKIILSNK